MFVMQRRHINISFDQFITAHKIITIELASGSLTIATQIRVCEYLHVHTIRIKIAQFVYGL